MKRIVFLFCVVLSAASCKKACVDCSASSNAFKGTICKSDYEAGAGKTSGAPSWSAYREILLTMGCSDSK